MDWKKRIGIALIVLGIWIIVAAGVITGAVVGLERENLFGVLGIMVLVLGVLVIAVARKLEQMVDEGSGILDVPEFFERIMKKKKDDGEIYLILDTSVVLGKNPAQLGDYLQKIKDKNVVVLTPESVLDEIYTLHHGEDLYSDSAYLQLTKKDKRSKELRRVVEENTEDLDGFKEYRQKARAYLERTDKPTLARELGPYVKRAQQGKLQDLNPTEAEKIHELAFRMRKQLGKDMEFKDFGAVDSVSNIFEHIGDYLSRLDVSDGDVDSIAMALCVADQGGKVLVAERDIDLRQAVEIIKAEDQKISRNLDFVEPYAQDYRPSEKRKKQLADYAKKAYAEV